MKYIVRIATLTCKNMVTNRVCNTYCTVNSMASSEIKLIPEVDNGLATNKMSFRKHPGSLRLSAVKLPQVLLKAVDAVMENYPVKDLISNSTSLTRHLWHRQLPAEPKDVQETALNIYKRYLAESNIDEENMDESTSKSFEKKTLDLLRKKIYNWQPIQYTPYNCYLYMASRMPVEYSILSKCFNEIRSRDLQFKPVSMLDIGSGTGSAIWAAHSFWKQSLRITHCVDPSTNMNVFSRLLLQGGDENKDMFIKGVHFSCFPPSIKNMFDLTVCAYSLFELPNRLERKRLILDLWKRTSSYMVLVDNGTTAGFKMLMEARDILLKLNKEATEVHIFAPCCHNLTCPKLSGEGKSPCSNTVQYAPFSFMSKEKTLTEMFCYVIFSRLPQIERWPRVIQEVQKRTRHTHIRICDQDAQIRHLVITKNKHSKILYKCARHTTQGDRFPVTFPLSGTEQTAVDADDGDVDNVSSFASSSPYIVNDPEDTLVDSYNGWSLYDTPTKVALPELSSHMLQFTSSENKE